MSSSRRLELDLGEAHLGPQRLLPHRGHRDRDLGVHLAGVVGELERERSGARVAGFPVEALRLGDARGHRLAPVVEGLRRVVVDPRRHPAVGRQLPDPQHQRGELLAVDDERQRAAQPRLVPEGCAAQVEAVVVGRELRGDVQLAREVLPNPVELSARHHRGDLELAASVAGELRVLVGDDEVLHRIESRRGVVPVIAVADGEDVRARHPFPEHEGAVRDHDPGAREALPGGARASARCTGQVLGWERSAGR